MHLFFNAFIEFFSRIDRHDTKRTNIHYKPENVDIKNV